MVTTLTTGRYQGVWSGYQITFTDSRGEKHELTTEIEMPGTDNPVTVCFDGGIPYAFDEDMLGIKLL